MSRKTTAALVAMLGINFLLAGGALLLANMNKPAAYDPGEGLAAGYADIKQVAGRPVDAEAGDLVVPLKAAQKGGNTRVTFTCGKDLGVAGREEHQGTWDTIAGAVLYRPDAKQLVAVEAAFDVRSLRTDNGNLTNTVLSGEKWFDYENHPTATFTCDSIKPVQAGDAGVTHELSGTFTLNGISKPLAIPATLTFASQSLTLDASFTILRSDYRVKARESSIAGSVGGAVATVDDAVVLTVRVTASPDPAAVIAELAEKIEGLQERLRIAQAERDLMDGRLQLVESWGETVDRLAATGVAPTQAVDEGNLPEQYTDSLQARFEAVPFEMVLVPGDAAAGIAPFYMSKTEVTWGMLGDWADHLGVAGEEEANHLIKLGLRPTKLFGNPRAILHFDDKQRPAMGMSRTTAEGFCKWLSDQTGRRYRLPTEQEWEYTLRLGGGVPDDLDAQVWHVGNAEADKYFTPIPGAAGSRLPNKLGIHDMLGSVCEWVSGTGVERVVRGGSVDSSPDEITMDWRRVENQSVWNANYPNDPKSRFWYSDFTYTGIRLVCEAPSVAANPPAGAE